MRFAQYEEEDMEAFNDEAEMQIMGTTLDKHQKSYWERFNKHIEKGRKSLFSAQLDMLATQGRHMRTQEIVDFETKERNRRFNIENDWFEEEHKKELEKRQKELERMERKDHSDSIPQWKKKTSKKNNKKY